MNFLHETDAAVLETGFLSLRLLTMAAERQGLKPSVINIIKDIILDGSDLEYTDGQLPLAVLGWCASERSGEIAVDIFYLIHCPRRESKLCALAQDFS